MTRHALEPALTIPLSLSYLCQGCQHVFAIASVCPRCGSPTVFPLARWLDREEAGR